MTERRNEERGQRKAVLHQLFCVANRVQVTGMTVGVVPSSVSNQQRTSPFEETRDEPAEEMSLRRVDEANVKASFSMSLESMIKAHH